MSKPKHTPGPWFIRTVNQGSDNLIPNDIRTGHSNDCEKVCGFPSPDDNYYTKTPYDEYKFDEHQFNRIWGNAHLIAAAPDLLDACENLLEKVKQVNDDPTDGVNYGFAGEEIIAAVRAIKKAKGEL